jgi:hypothetical protein
VSRGEEVPGSFTMGNYFPLSLYCIPGFRPDAIPYLSMYAFYFKNAGSGYQISEMHDLNRHRGRQGHRNYNEIVAAQALHVWESWGDHGL